MLSDVQPDVIGLQEVCACGGQNHAQWLASHLDMHWAWAPSGAPEQWQRRLGDSTVDIGNAVLSRWPIADHDVAQLPARQHDDDAPLALHARINAPTHQVPFFTTHLSSAVDASAIRCQQVEALVRFVASHSQATDFPPIVTGDVSAFPDSDEVRQFGGYKTGPVLPRQVFLDAWEYADPAQPSATWNATNPYVAARFELRVDYIHLERVSMIRWSVGRMGRGRNLGTDPRRSLVSGG